MQAVAPLDCLAHLPGPPSKGNRGAASIYAGQLLAYAAASAVVVVDVSGQDSAERQGGRVGAGRRAHSSFPWRCSSGSECSQPW